MRLLLAAMLTMASLALPGQGADRALHIQAAERSMSAPEARVALVIGNASYSEAPLRNPVNDARAMKEALASCGFTVTLLTDASKRQMEDAIRAFGDAIRGGAVGLFYFAGHGGQVKGVNYLVPVGARMEREDEVPYQAVEAGQVLDKMDAAKNRLNILILDACRNNPFAHSWRGAGGQGLAQVQAPTGSLIAYATAPGSTAADGAGDHGLYTEALLAQLREPGLELEKVFKRVREQVLAASKGGQTPWESNSTVGDFCFRPQRTAAEITREQAAVQAETRRLEEALKAQEAQAHSAQAARQADLLRIQLSVQSLEKQRLAQEETRSRELEAEVRRAQADAARRGEEAARLEALKQRLAKDPHESLATPDHLSLAGARQAVERLVRQREALLRPVQAGLAQALRKLDEDYAGLRQRVEAPRDEFETTAQYQDRLAQAQALRTREQRERVAVEGQYAELSRTQVAPVEAQIQALKEQRFPASYPVELGAYLPDEGDFSLRIPMGEHRAVQALLALEPGRAKELKSRRELLRAEGDTTLAAGQGLPDRVVDPVWGALPLRDMKVSLEPGAQQKIALGHGVSLDLVLLPPGRFMMGSSEEPDGRPVHEVRLSHPFWLGREPVTQAQWEAVMADTPSNFRGADLPVEQVSWEHCQQFLARLNGLGQGTFRLPTEAEWEYACRAGGTGERYGALAAIAWYDGNSANRTRPVGQRQPNAFGLYDMLGNVCQWCQDWYGDYPAEPVTNPQGPASGTNRVFRGSGWNESAPNVRASARGRSYPADRDYDLGLRIVRTAP